MSVLQGELAIELIDVTRRMGREPVLRGVSLEVAPGKLVVLRGANGTGKTTLLRLLATRLRPSSGRAVIFGHELPKSAAAARARLGLLSVVGGSFPMLSARENLELAVSLSGGGARGRADTTEADQSGAEEAGAARSGAGGAAVSVTGPAPSGTRASVTGALQAVGLESAHDKLVRTFSSGMKKRLGLARLLLLDPDLWLLDEPYAALDDAGKRLMDGCVAAAKARGRTVLMASHESDRDQLLPDAVIELKGGTLRMFGA